MKAELRILPPAAKYFKKLKDKQLLKKFQNAIDQILENPTIGEAKTGTLSSVFCYDLYYNKTNYELAYTIEAVENTIVIVIMAGPRENFYDSLKRYWNK